MLTIVLSMLFMGPSASANLSASNTETETETELGTEIGTESYDGALDAVHEATIATNANPDAGPVELGPALERLLDHAPRLAVDRDGRAIQLRGALTLARAALVRGDRAQATAIIDRWLTALRLSDDPSTLARDQLGPRLYAFVSERGARNPDQALTRLHIHCSNDCSLIVDGWPIPTLGDAGVPLTRGAHEIWVQAEGVAPLRERVDVDAHQPSQHIYYPVAEPPPPAMVDAPSGSRDRPPMASITTKPPVAPRAVELSMIIAGAGAVGAGIGLAVIDDTCAGPGPRMGVGACTNLHDTKAAGITSLTVGASALLVGTILTVVDERRRRKSRN